MSETSFVVIHSHERRKITTTGTASGIGLTTAKLLAKRGAILSVREAHEARVNEAFQQLSGSGHFATKVDASKASEVNSWIENTVKKLGGLDGAANVASIEREGGRHFADGRDEDWELVMGVNCSGVFYSLRARIRQMLRKGGSVVNVASIAGLIGVVETTCYNANKFAVMGLTRTAARAYGSHNIKINSVAPGWWSPPLRICRVIATPLVHAMETQELDSQADPKKVANVITFLLSDEASFVTGSTYKVDGGSTAEAS
ncbi:hypothetical protein A1O7_09017 [Cladophialophora yegresii CBS 114405]|uniref:Uncharacterized protein n=1 Tax=Cladophialophora yegresii CBS 114405 TaxID=1182544 RepID=W9VV86_9EURO|nr:uncharacterized protein A1O7_09017 [Cladophialophora yegresii CBS 114405]EXJ56086.1 hypothetical protein A1O7_09017 [Cladophialophora yegresii CBS 114405]